MLATPRVGASPIARLDHDIAKQCRLWKSRARGLLSDASSNGHTRFVLPFDTQPAGALREGSPDNLAVEPRNGRPPTHNSLGRRADITDLRYLNIADLLGREPIDTDIAARGGYLWQKRVLITGAGGSIGSELCRQVYKYGPRELIMLDHDDSALHAVQLSIYHDAMMNTRELVLADIRDRTVVMDLFRDRKPDVVFHAAALKHLPMLESYPLEAWKTNVIGTANVVEASHLANVERFVNISTDKAANPTSVLGYTKRLGERLVADSVASANEVYLSVRFGNVLGSRGSVLTTFADQIAAGIPVTITHPEVSRFFMTIPEAVQLVIQAAAIGRRAEALVLDMGRPVPIADLARQLMRQTGRTVDIVYAGLRDGEKLHEELFAHGEVDERPIHPAISHVSVPPLAIAQLPVVTDPEQAMRALLNLITRRATTVRVGARAIPAPSPSARGTA